MKKTPACVSVLWILVLFACTAKETETTNESAATPVHVIEVCSRKSREQQNLIGIIGIDREMKLAFKLSGKLARLDLEEGRRVSKGTLLARLDTTEWVARKEKALENRAKARRDLERMEALREKRIVPESSWQDARSAYNVSCAELKIIDDALENCTVTAPFTGKIMRKLAEEGEVIGAGIPFALLGETDPVLVKAAIPDRLLPRIKAGDTALIRVDWEPDRTYTGTIRRLETAADPVTRTIRAEIRVSNPDETLKPGLMAQVVLEGQEAEACIHVPLEAVIGFGKAPYVFVIEDLHAHKREIRLGRVIQEEVEIIEGLVPGETVVVSGQEYLRDHHPVTITGMGVAGP